MTTQAADRSAGGSGTQVVHRVARLLRAVAAREEGATVAELAAATGLTRPTAHRLLTGLAEEGLVDRPGGTGAWQLGPELYVLGSVAAHRYPIRELAGPSLRRLAETTGESAFLSVRRGLETVCLSRVEGAFPIRSHVLYEGLRLPLGVASAGLAILAHLPPRRRSGCSGPRPGPARRGGRCTPRSGSGRCSPTSAGRATRSTPA